MKLHKHFLIFEISKIEEQLERAKNRVISLKGSLTEAKKISKLIEAERDKEKEQQKQIREL